jgi:hypothetical protein
MIATRMMGGRVHFVRKFNVTPRAQDLQAVRRVLHRPKPC